MYKTNDFIFPALLFDKNFVLIEKNIPASERKEHNFNWKKLQPKLNTKDFLMVQNLKAGESVIITLRFDTSTIPAIAFFDGDEYLVRTNVIAVTLKTRINSLCDGISKQLISLSALSHPSTNGKKHYLDKAMFLQTRLNDIIRLMIGFRIHPQEIVDVYKLAESIVYGFKTALENYKMSLRLEPFGENTFVYASSTDISFALASGIALTFILSKTPRTSIQIKKILKNRITVEMSFSESRYPELIEQLNNCDSFEEYNSVNNEEAFLVYYIRLICEIYGGTAKLIKNPNGDYASLVMHFIEYKEDIMVLSSSAPNELLLPSEFFVAYKYLRSILECLDD